MDSLPTQAFDSFFKISRDEEIAAGITISPVISLALRLSKTLSVGLLVLSRRKDLQGPTSDKRDGFMRVLQRSDCSDIALRLKMYESCVIRRDMF